jgi:ubiquitin C-terminal hydrolase
MVRWNDGVSFVLDQQGNIDQGRQIYDLYGVCNHYGNMLGGHYTGMFENFEGDTQKTVKS